MEVSDFNEEVGNYYSKSTFITPIKKQEKLVFIREYLCVFTTSGSQNNQKCTAFLFVALFNSNFYIHVHVGKTCSFAW